MRVVLTICCLCLAVTLGATAALAGPLLSYVNQTYCANTVSEKNSGCAKYWNFRITEGQARNDSLNNCNNGCATEYKEPVQVRSCKTGCSMANFMDK